MSQAGLFPDDDFIGSITGVPSLKKDEPFDPSQYSSMPDDSSLPEDDGFFETIPLSAYELDADGAIIDSEAEAVWDNPQGQAAPEKEDSVAKALASLNEEQYQAATHTAGKLLVIAGPGSGKTHTLTTRCAHLVNEGTPPGRILLVTFTKKASKEMAERASKLHPACHYLKVGTFHSVALDLLKRKNFGNEPTWAPLAPADVGDAFYACVNEFVDRKVKEHPGRAMEFFLRKKPSEIKKFIHAQRGEGKMPLHKFKENWGKGKNEDEIASNMREWEIVLGAYAYFPKWKERHFKLEYDDMVPTCVKMLKSRPDLRSYFEYVCIDEFQDTSPDQKELAELLSEGNGNLMVVGDDCQSIYEWRKACIENFFELQNELGEAGIIRLQTNYRSCPKIVTLTNMAMTSIIRRAEKTLKYVRESVGQMPPALFYTREEQALGIKEKIQQALAEGVDPKEICVLFRSHKNRSGSLPLQRLLAESGIPFRLSGGVAFLEKKEVRHVLAMMRLAIRPSELESWSLLLGSIYGIGEVTLYKLSSKLAKCKEISEAVDYLLNGFKFAKNVDMDSVRHLCGVLEPMGQGYLSAESALFLGENWVMGMKEQLYKIDDEPEEDGEVSSIEEKIKESLDYMKSLCSNGQSISSFVDMLFTSTGDEEKSDEQAKVTLSTIHSAKGLEWDIVFVADLYNGFFPNERAHEKWLSDVKNWKQRNNMGVLPPDASGAEIIEGVPDDVVSMYQKCTLDEERRLFYVAISRARKHLGLSTPVCMYAKGPTGVQKMYLEPSELLQPLFTPEMWRKFYSCASTLFRERTPEAFEGFIPNTFVQQTIDVAPK